MTCLFTPEDQNRCKQIPSIAASWLKLFLSYKLECNEKAFILPQFVWTKKMSIIM